MDVGLNHQARKLVGTLGYLEEEIGIPKTIRCDRGSGVHLQDLGRIALKKRCVNQAHTSRQAYAKWIHGTTEQILWGRLTRCVLVQRPSPTREKDKLMVEGL